MDEEKEAAREREPKRKAAIATAFEPKPIAEQEVSIGFVADVEKRTPAAWAERLGHIRRGNPKLPQTVTHPDYQHAAADQLYGWSTHAYNYQSEPFEISQADYQSALESASKFPCCAPHAPALPPSQAARFQGFKPRAARVRSKEKR